MAKKATKGEKAPGDLLAGDETFGGLLRALARDPADWDCCRVAADFCEEGGEPELALALRWMAAHEKAPQHNNGQFAWCELDSFIWTAEAPGLSEHNLWCLFRNRNHWVLPTYLEALQFLTNHLLKARKQFTVPGDILHDR